MALAQTACRRVSTLLAQKTTRCAATCAVRVLSTRRVAASCVRRRNLSTHSYVSRVNVIPAAVSSPSSSICLRHEPQWRVSRQARFVSTSTETSTETDAEPDTTTVASDEQLSDAGGRFVTMEKLTGTQLPEAVEDTARDLSGTDPERQNVLDVDFARIAKDAEDENNAALSPAQITELMLDEKLKRIISLENASAKDISEARIKLLREKYRTHETDCGSSQVQSMFHLPPLSSPALSTRLCLYSSLVSPPLTTCSCTARLVLSCLYSRHSH
jgi:hypothetical protein